MERGVSWSSSPEIQPSASSMLDAKDGGYGGIHDQIHSLILSEVSYTRFEARRAAMVRDLLDGQASEVLGTRPLITGKKSNADCYGTFRTEPAESRTRCETSTAGFGIPIAREQKGGLGLSGFSKGLFREAVRAVTSHQG